MYDNIPLSSVTCYRFTKLQKEAEETQTEKVKLENQLRETVEESDTLKNLLTTKLNKVRNFLRALVTHRLFVKCNILLLLLFLFMLGSIILLNLRTC